MKILVVDDEMNIRNVVREYAEHEGFKVDEAGDGMEAVSMAKAQDYDLIVMDVMMPRLDGFSACKEIRKTKDTPIIILSARDDEYDQQHGFDLGIDDYVTKPFSPPLLMARVKAVVSRRNSSRGNVSDPMVFEGLEINMSGREVYVDGKRANMTPKEYDLLFYLVKNPPNTDVPFLPIYLIRQFSVPLSSFVNTTASLITYCPDKTMTSIPSKSVLSIIRTASLAASRDP